MEPQRRQIALIASRTVLALAWMSSLPSMSARAAVPMVKTSAAPSAYHPAGAVENFRTAMDSHSSSLASRNEEPNAPSRRLLMLDLRPPLLESPQPAYSFEGRPVAESKARLHGSPGFEDHDRDLPFTARHEESGLKGFGQRFKREGLPIARLWENHAALVSLGLNQRGKPGLWLTQKTH